MAVSSSDIILAAVGFLLVAILTPIGMNQVMNATVTSWNTSVVTIFQVLLPILYIVGAALYFVPRFRK